VSGKRQPSLSTLAFLRLSGNKLPYFYKEAKQQYKERQLYNGYTDLP